MQLRQASLAIPGESLADISPELGEGPAGNLLALWTALWDPALIAHTRSIPVTQSLSTLLEDERNPHELVLIPAVAQSDSTDGWHADDPLVPRLHKFDRRSEVISQLADALEIERLGEVPLAADFYALGFAYLQIELLTRSMQYDPMVSQDSLRTAVVEAADAAMAGNEDAMADHLEEAYDHLTQSRNHYYPIDFYLIDLLLTAPSVAGRVLADDCRAGGKQNVLITGELLDHLAEQHPESLAELKRAVDDERITVCGGSNTDTPLNSLTPEALLSELRTGSDAFLQHLGQRPTVFAHTAGPVAPLVPGVLHKLGYHAVVMSNFSGIPLPPSSASRITWTGLDSTPIEALAAEPIDMGSNSAAFSLSRKMQQTMNYDLAASLLLVGWPGHRTEWHADLLQVARRSSLLGQLVTLDEYFESTTSQDYAGMMAVEAYRSATMDSSPKGSSQELASHTDSVATQVASLARVVGATEDSCESIAKVLAPANSNEDGNGTLWLNASSFARGHGGEQTPAFGWRWEETNALAKTPARCEPGVLRNECMELVFDEQTGGISATRLHAHRGNQLSQQLFLSPVGTRGIAAGLQLAVDGWRVVESSDVIGTLATECRIVDRNAKTVANIQQLTSLARHSTQIDVQIQFEPLAETAKDCELGSRVAVREEEFCVTRGVQGVDLPTSRPQIVAEWLGLGGEPMPLAVFCDAPRQHRRHSGRMLDTAMFMPGGKTNDVRLSYVFDCRYPAQAFAADRHPQQLVCVPSACPRQTSGWWLHFGSKNVMATSVATESLEEGLIVRLRLLETAGRPANTSLAAWQPIADARQLNFLGEPDQLLSTTDGTVRLSLAPYEFVEIEILLDRKE